MTLGIILLAAGAALSVFMAGAWRAQRVTGNSGWVDVTWTLSLGLVAAILALVRWDGGEIMPRQWLVAGIAGVWSLRLGAHLIARTRVTPDDPRYADLMAQWGATAARRLFRFLQIQAAFAWLLAAAIMAAAHNPAPFPSTGDVLAVIVFILGLAGAATADGQLRRFKAQPANKGLVCDVGLWRWSRHPNYFFEWLCWLAYPLLAIGDGYALGYAAVIAPLCMYWLLVHVSGIPPLETHMMRTRGGRFAVYRMRTNAFFPWPPKGG